MNTGQSKWIEMASAAIQSFSEDGSLDMDEVNFLLTLVLQDDEIDDEERQVLQALFEKGASLFPNDVAEKVKEIQDKHHL